MKTTTKPATAPAKMGPAMQAAIIRGTILEIEEAQAAVYVNTRKVERLQADLERARRGEW